MKFYTKTFCGCKASKESLNYHHLFIELPEEPRVIDDIQYHCLKDGQNYSLKNRYDIRWSETPPANIKDFLLCKKIEI